MNGCFIPPLLLAGGSERSQVKDEEPLQRRCLFIGSVAAKESYLCCFSKQTDLYSVGAQCCQQSVQL